MFQATRLRRLLKAAGHDVLFKRIVSDDKDMIEHAVKSVLDNAGVDAAIFCGGTGITHSDVTIETVSPFFEKTLPGFRGDFQAPKLRQGGFCRGDVARRGWRRTGESFVLHSWFP